MTFLMCFGIAQYVVLSAVLGTIFGQVGKGMKGFKWAGGLMFAIFWPGIIVAKFIALEAGVE
jgi:hypothetical protein